MCLTENLGRYSLNILCQGGIPSAALFSRKDIIRYVTLDVDGQTQVQALLGHGCDMSPHTGGFMRRSVHLWNICLHNKVSLGSFSSDLVPICHIVSEQHF
jgi:hypothetical protein